MANPFVHVELNTDDVGRAKAFYKKLFDWKLTDMPAMNYTMLDVGSGVGGGMMKKMDGAPTMWLPYVEVASVKATVGKAKKAGATVYVEYQSIGEMGAIGVFSDPAGAAIGVWEKGAGAAPPPPKKAAKKAPAKKAPAKKAPAKKAPAKAPAPAPAAPAKKPAKKAAKKKG